MLLSAGAGLISITVGLGSTTPTHDNTDTRQHRHTTTPRPGDTASVMTRGVAPQAGRREIAVRAPYRALSSSMTESTDFLASPNSMEV